MDELCRMVSNGYGFEREMKLENIQAKFIWANIKGKNYQAYYNMKDCLLKLVQPTCIHKEEQLHKIRIYDYEDAYHQYPPEEIIYKNTYYDRDFEEWTSFINVMVPESKYYLFYDFGDYSFHTPISDPKQYPDMNVIEISQLDTHGHAIEDLISVQFVKRVVDLVKSGEYTYVA